MLLRTVDSRSFRLVAALCLLTLILAGCGSENYPQTTLLPRGDFARIADDLLDTTVKWAVLVFVLVEGALLYAIFRFRGKPGDPEPRQIHGNTTIEIIWTVIPALILAAIAVPTVKGIFQTNAHAGAGSALRIEVIGHQWWWEFRYPQYDLVTANEMVHPRWADRALHMSNSVRRDPQLLAAAVRRQARRLSRPGDPDLVQGGLDRALSRPVRGVLRHPARPDGVPRPLRDVPRRFSAWVAHMQTLGPPKPAADSGARRQRLAPDGQRRCERPPPQEALAGPLSRPGREAVPGTRAVSGAIRSRPRARRRRSSDPTWRTSGRGPTSPRDGSRTRTRTWRRWIRNPQGLKKGVLMPNLGVSPNEAQALRAYLRAHK